MDLCHTVCALQSELVSPQVVHLLEASSLLKRAQADSSFNGLHFAPLRSPLRLVPVADVGHASKRSNYPYEGKLVLLMHDGFAKQASHEWLTGQAASALGGDCHILFFSARRASRISHSTSQAETLSAIGCTQVAHLISGRLGEIFLAPRLFGRSPSIRDLLWLQSNSCQEVPVDHCSDCMDLYELITGSKGLSADKGQRLAVMSLREDKTRGITRYTIHVPSPQMVADGLTKGWDLLAAYAPVHNRQMDSQLHHGLASKPQRWSRASR